MPKNHCSIRFNTSTNMWEGSHNGQILMSDVDLEVVESRMFAHGFNIQNVDIGSEPTFLNSIKKYGCN